MAHPFASEAKSSEAKRKDCIGAYKHGGSVPGRKSIPKKMAVPDMEEQPMKGGAPRQRLDRFNRGGPVKGKAGTTVNVVVAPKESGPGPMPMLPPPVAAAPPPMPPKPPMPPMGAAGPMPGGPMPMPGMGGPKPFKRGGTVHSDAKADRRAVQGAVHTHDRQKHKGQGLTKFESGGVVRGKGLGLKAGAGDGEGRLEKVALARRK